MIESSSAGARNHTTTQPRAAVMIVVMRFLGWWYLPWLFACGDSSGTSIPPDTAKSGSRLKLAWFEMPDGFSTWANADDLYDAQLALACKPRLWADGVTRCTPELQSFMYYADAACAQPILADTDAGARYAARLGKFGCVGVPGELFKSTGEPIATTLVWTPTDVGCASRTLMGPDGRPIMISGVVAEPVAVSSLASVETVFEGNGHVVIATTRSDDGLLVPVRPYDATLGFGCELGRLDHVTSSLCVPGDAPVFMGTYADAACQAPVTLFARGCEPPPIIQVPTLLSCPLLYATGAALDADPMLYEQLYRCTAMPPSYMQDVTAYRLGARLDPVALTRTPEPSGLRAQLIYIESAGARFRETGRVFDGELATECMFERLMKVPDGGTAVCRPSLRAEIKWNLFADAACTEPLPEMAAMSDDPGCGVRVLPAIIDSYNDVYRLGPLRQGTVYESGVALNECNAYSFHVYELGERIDGSRMLTAVKRRDD